MYLHTVADMPYLGVGVLFFISPNNHIAILRLQLDGTALAIQLGGGYQCRTATAEWFVYRIPFVAAVEYEFCT